MQKITSFTLLRLYVCTENKTRKKTKNNMKTKIAMRERGLRYFSTLTEKQRRESLLMMNKITHQLLDLPDGLVTSIIFGAGLNFVDLSGCKMFCHKGTNIWYPLNFNEVIKETKTRK